MDVMKELNALSIRKPLSEAEVRDIVGAPTLEEEEHCVCGERLEECKDSYSHMTHGV
jgi:hypothetical protein